jgi:hypothetical protein
MFKYCLTTLLVLSMLDQQFVSECRMKVFQVVSRPSPAKRANMVVQSDTPNCKIIVGFKIKIGIHHY